MTSDLTSALEVSHIMRYTNRRILYFHNTVQHSWPCGCIYSSRYCTGRRRNNPFKTPFRTHYRQPHLSSLALCPRANLEQSHQSDSSSPRYMSSCFTHVANTLSHRRLRSSTSDQLLTPSFHLAKVGKHTFQVASAYLWNDGPPEVT